MTQQKIRTYQSVVPTLSLVHVAPKTIPVTPAAKVVLIRSRDARKTTRPISRYRWKRELTKQEIVIKLIEHLTMNP